MSPAWSSRATTRSARSSATAGTARRLQGGKKWGTNPALLAELRITYTDGTTTRVTTDNSWQTGSGGLQTSGIYDGETYDARLDKPGWDQPGFATTWPSAVERNETMAVEPSQAPPIKVIDTLAPKTVTQPAPGTYIYDLGQNFAGWARIKVTGQSGTKVRLRFGEILNQDGTLYTANLRSALQTDTYTLRGGATETYEPRFTYHGVRYVEVTGAQLESLEGRVVSSDLPDLRHVHQLKRPRKPDPERDPLGPALELPRRAERCQPARRAPRLDR